MAPIPNEGMASGVAPAPYTAAAWTPAAADPGVCGAANEPGVAPPSPPGEKSMALGVVAVPVTGATGMSLSSLTNRGDGASPSPSVKS